MRLEESLQLVVGAGGYNRLQAARVIVFGVGGAGSYATEVFARTGIGGIDIVDDDTVTEAHIGQQLTACFSVMGRPKADVCRERINLINPYCTVNSYEIFATPENIREFPIEQCDYVVDTTDCVAVKAALAKYCEDNGVPIISGLSAKNRINPALFKIADIYETSVCPLAEKMRAELKKAGVKGLKTVFSLETPKISDNGKEGCLSYASGIIGMMIAGEVISELLMGVAK